MSSQNPYKGMAGFCLFHYIPTQQFKQHLHLCIYSRCLWQETPSQLHSCGWAAVAASPESQGTNKSHTKVRDSSWAKRSQLWSHQTKQSKSNHRASKLMCFALARAQPRGGRWAGRAERGCSAFANRSARHPVLLPPICSVSGMLEQLLQLQVHSQNGPRGRWNLSSHEPQVGAHYNSNLKLGRIYSWGYFYWIINLSPLPE